MFPFRIELFDESKKHTLIIVFLILSMMVAITAFFQKIYLIYKSELLLSRVLHNNSLIIKIHINYRKNVDFTHVYEIYFRF